MQDNMTQENMQDNQQTTEPLCTRGAAANRKEMP
jgi:hypothetical protein